MFFQQCLPFIRFNRFFLFLRGGGGGGGGGAGGIILLFFDSERNVHILSLSVPFRRRSVSTS